MPAAAAEGEGADALLAEIDAMEGLDTPTEPQGSSTAEVDADAEIREIEELLGDLEV